MDNSVSIIATTKEGDLKPEDLLNEAKILAGKSAAVCYSQEDYFCSSKIQNEESAIKRADKRGKIHQSIHDHYHISFYMKIPKFMCMLLNSINVYNSSEQSGRYTVLKEESELQHNIYTKWKDRSFEILHSILHDYKSDDEIIKLAQENARYMTSVWTPTHIVYTISFRQAVLLIDHLIKLSDSVGQYLNNHQFWFRLADECKSLAVKMSDVLGITLDDLPLYDIKNQNFRFLDNIKKRELHPLNWVQKKESLLDSYTLSYNMSFSAIAEAIRHRSIRYSIYMDLQNPKYYIPFFIKDTILQNEWLKDINQISKETTPQGMLVCVTEQGLFEDFVLKCKERLCGRTLTEVRQVTKESMEKFVTNKQNLSIENIMLLERHSSYSDGVVPRCCFSDFECKEPCYMGSYGLYNC